MSTTLYRSAAENDEMNQLTFALKYFPMSALTESAKQQVIFNRYEFMTKKQVEELCNEDKNRLFFSTEHHQDPERATWKIVWTNNNMPTELAWIMVSPERRLKVELRVTRQWGRVAILSFANPDPKHRSHSLI